MIKLKTLKDLNRYELGGSLFCNDWESSMDVAEDGDYIDYDELRQEAIKQYKFYSQSEPDKMFYRELLKFIEEFFNITEEDLK